MRTSARSAMVSSVSGASTRKRWLIGPRQLAQHERVEPVGFAARGAEAVARGARPGWGGSPARTTPQPTAARPAARPVARSRPASPSGAHSATQRPHTLPHHARTWPPAAPRPPRSARPRRATRTPNRCPRNYLPCVLLFGQVFTAPRPRGTVAGAHRQALNGATPCCRLGTSPRREALVSHWPSTGQAIKALSRRRSRHQEDDL